MSLECTAEVNSLNKSNENIPSIAKKSACIIVRECRETISPEIYGEKLHPLLSAAVIKAGFPADKKPFSTWIDKKCGFARSCKSHGQRD